MYHYLIGVPPITGKLFSIVPTGPMIRLNPLDVVCHRNDHQPLDFIDAKMDIPFNTTHNKVWEWAVLFWFSPVEMEPYLELMLDLVQSGEILTEDNGHMIRMDWECRPKRRHDFYWFYWILDIVLVLVLVIIVTVVTDCLRCSCCANIIIYLNEINFIFVKLLISCSCSCKFF